MRTLRRWVFTAGGLMIATSSAVIALGNRSAKVTSYTTTSPGFAVLSSLTGATLLAAAALLARSGQGTRTRAALATFAVGTAWSADAWTGWSSAPTVVRNAAMLLVPMLAPVALLAIGSMLGGRAASTAAVVAGAGIASAVALWLVRDPFLDRYCWRDCLVHPFAPFRGAELARTATNVELAFGAVCATFSRFHMIAETPSPGCIAHAKLVRRVHMRAARRAVRVCRRGRVTGTVYASAQCEKREQACRDRRGAVSRWATAGEASSSSRRSTSEFSASSVSGVGARFRLQIRMISRREQSLGTPQGARLYCRRARPSATTELTHPHAETRFASNHCRPIMRH
jgi:hypothetical protein